MTDLPVMSAVALDATAEAMVENAPSISYTAWAPVMQALRAEVARLREAAEWRPIETAPKDGTWVRLYCPDGLDVDAIHRVAFWSDRTYAGDNEYDHHAGSWYSWEGASNAIPETPTHWKPLSPPPQVEEGR